VSGWAALRVGFRWELPERYNIGVDVADRQRPDAPAILVTDGRAVTRTVTFGELAEQSNRLANALAALGIGRGDRVGIVLPQRPETAIAHIAVYKLGAVAVPLSMLFGPEALESRLADCGARAVVGEAEALSRIPAALDLVRIDADRDLPRLLADASPRFAAADTGPDDPAIVIYTSGTTGPPKGALHGHRILLGHLPGVELPHEHLPQPGDLIWTPADWAWIGGLYDVLLPALHHGVPVVAFRAQKFDPEQAAELVARLGVRNLFVPPTALRMLRGAGGPPLSVRSVASGGEPLGEETLAWGRERFGVTINEFYGQTEANLVIGNCSSSWPVRPGSMGLPLPGHEIAVLDGEICVRADGDPVVMLGYWNRPQATAEKIRDGWLRTGDMGEQDADGYVRFLGRADDVISSGGYRIGPGEIEECLLRHPAVALAAAIGSPDPLRGEIVKAFVVAAPGAVVTPELAASLQAHVRERLAAYEYPREIAFVDSLPLTTTGKIRRGELRRLDAERREKESP
jgi:acetyl-CoA synthetase